MNEESPLTRLLEGWLDGGLPEAESAALLDLLDTDPELRRAFAREVAFLGKLRAASDAEPRWLALFDEFAESADPTGFEAETMSRIGENIVRPRFGALAGWIALAAAVVTLGFLFTAFRPEPTPAVVAEVTKHANPVAIVTGVSDNGKGGGLEAANFLPPGRIRQTEGWLAIQTLTGVSITLTAPFEIDLINPQRVFVKEGQARVFVPEGAEGFTMESASFEVIDLGTEFATTVNADGTGSCKVFEGMADVSFLDSLGSSSATRRVNAGEDFDILPSERSMIPNAGPARDYAEMVTPPKPLLPLAPSYPTDVLALRPTDYWRFERMDSQEIPNEVSGRPAIRAFGDVGIEAESGGNHSGRLKYRKNNGAFVAETTSRRSLSGDFTVAMFVQFDWLQNYTLFASSRWDVKNPRIPRGNQLLFKAYASFGQSGIRGTGLHSVFRDQPAWDGGVEVFGNQLLRPKFWHHVALTRNGSEAILHLDGIQVAREAVPSVPINFDHLYIGRSDSPSRPPEFLERGLIGNVDEAVIFDRALSPGEIAVLAAGESSQ